MDYVQTARHFHDLGDNIKWQSCLSRRHTCKLSVVSYYFCVKYIDCTQLTCVFSFLHFDHFCQNVLLISGALTATMTASVRMEQNVIHEQVLVPAPLGGRGWFVKSHVTKVTMVTNVKNSVNAWMAAHVTLLWETARADLAILGNSKYFILILCHCTFLASRNWNLSCEHLMLGLESIILTRLVHKKMMIYNTTKKKPLFFNMCVLLHGNCV